MDAIKRFVESLKIGRKQEHVNLALFPLMAADAGEPGYLILYETISDGFYRQWMTREAFGRRGVGTWEMSDVAQDFAQEAKRG
jgi:hypothetical protein